jgi:hypothetical protein
MSDVLMSKKTLAAAGLSLIPTAELERLRLAEKVAEAVKAIKDAGGGWQVYAGELSSQLNTNLNEAVIAYSAAIPRKSP